MKLLQRVARQFGAGFPTRTQASQTDAGNPAVGGAEWVAVGGGGSGKSPPDISETARTKRPKLCRGAPLGPPRPSPPPTCAWHGVGEAVAVRVGGWGTFRRIRGGKFKI